MNKKQRRALASFMSLVLHQMHPNFHEYPIREMKEVEYSEGGGFDGTEYQNSIYLIQAYYMNQAIEEIRKDTS